MKLCELEKVSLGVFPTPLQKMERLAKELGSGDLYIKRDDLTDVGLSGNKIRKLEYLAAEAKAEGCNTLLTFGGPQTNHGRLTAAAAVRCGMKCILILTGERPDYMSGNLLLDQLMGADLYFTTGDPEEAAKKVIAQYEAAGDKVYVIPTGGSNELGAVGYIQMIPELMAQCKEMGIAPKYLVCGSGSQGTFGGLWLGAKYYNAPFEVLGVTINPATPRTPDSCDEYINRMSEMYGLGVTAKGEEIRLFKGNGEENYAGIAYNTPDPATRSHIALLARTEAIFLDPCYTGKVFHGFVDMVKSGIIPKGESAIFLHTGGIPALWTKEHLDSFQEELWGEGSTHTI